MAPAKAFKEDVKRVSDIINTHDIVAPKVVPKGVEEIKKTLKSQKEDLYLKAEDKKE